jgi:hypothetical protein
MRDIGYGRVEDLGVTGGRPHITPATKLFRRIRLDRPDQPPLRADHTNHRPHAQHEKLLAHCRAIGAGMIRKVEVADGLPVHWDSA